MKTLTKIKDQSVVEPTRWACFQYGAQARRLSFPSSYVPSGTLVRDFTLVAFSYLSGRPSVGGEGAGFLPLSTVTPPFSSLFRLRLPVSSLFRP